MRDVAQQIASDAYRLDLKGIAAGLLVLAFALFLLWFKEKVKR